MPAPKKIKFKISQRNCFNCTSHAANSVGYPLIRTNGKKKTICRFIYEECFGEIPDGMILMHQCDNPLCINPEHLKVGTYAENNKDCWKRKRRLLNPRKSFKLSDEDVKKIRKDSRFHKDIAKEYGVSRVYITDVINNKKRMGI